MTDILSEIFTQAAPALYDLIGIVLMVALTWASNELRKWVGIQIEDKHRVALHSALMTGIRTAIEKNPGAARDLLVNDAVAYARQSVPDAIKKLSPDNFILRRIADRYANEVISNVAELLRRDGAGE